MKDIDKLILENKIAEMEIQVNNLSNKVNKLLSEVHELRSSQTTMQMDCD